ncbi:MAG: hypothetical protein Kilf2KO_42530 [Rhodospirillales bacterium]
MRIEDFEGKGPTLDLESYFEGACEAWGLVEDRFGRLRRQFKVEIKGERLETGIRLVEDFTYDDGQQESRTWVLTPLGGGRYEGRAEGVIGVARGRVCGSAFHWTYRLRLTIAGKDRIVAFDDWMFLQSDGVLINRARLSKFGVTLAEVTLVFRPKAPTESAITAAAA